MVLCDEICRIKPDGEGLFGAIHTFVVTDMDRGACH